MNKFQRIGFDYCGIFKALHRRAVMRSVGRAEVPAQALLGRPQRRAAPAILLAVADD